jgi:hypothetical protein
MKRLEWEKEAELAAKKEFPLDVRNRVGEFFWSVGSVLVGGTYVVLMLEFLSLIGGKPWAAPWSLVGASLAIGFLFTTIGNHLAGQRRASVAAFKQALLDAYEAQPAAEAAAEEHFYSGPEWRRLRTYAIGRDGRICQNPECGRYIDSDFDLTVDHIKPKSLFPELALDLSNVQVLCRECNSSKGNQTSLVFSEHKNLRTTSARRPRAQEAGNNSTAN